MKIPWELLESARGHADPTQIPRHLEMLFSPNATERKAAYWGIDNHAVVQSDLCTSAPYAAYLIADRLDHGKAATPEAIEALIEIYLGSGPEQLQVGPLAGESLEALCQRFVRKAAEILQSGQDQLDGASSQKIDELAAVISPDN